MADEWSVCLSTTEQIVTRVNVPLGHREDAPIYLSETDTGIITRGDVAPRNSIGILVLVDVITCALSSNRSR